MRNKKYHPNLKSYELQPSSTPIAGRVSDEEKIINAPEKSEESPKPSGLDNILLGAKWVDENIPVIPDFVKGVLAPAAITSAMAAYVNQEHSKKPRGMAAKTTGLLAGLAGAAYMGYNHPEATAAVLAITNLASLIVEKYLAGNREPDKSYAYNSTTNGTRWPY